MAWHSYKWSSCVLSKNEANYLIQIGSFINKDILGVDWEAHGSVVVKALCYKPEGRGFDSR
jgi:hypothetical protein